MKYVYRLIAILILLGVVGLIGFAYLGNLRPTQSPVKEPVTLNAD